MKIKTIRNVLLGAVLATGLAAAKNSAPPLTGDAAIMQKAVHQVRMYTHYGVFDNIEIQVNDGTLHLIGEVTQPYKKSDLGKIMAHIPGVTTVDNELTVAPLSSFDDGIRRQVARAIFRDPMLAQLESQPFKTIHIIVNNGHVSLEGYVNTQQQKNVAGMDANRSMSFGNVVNNLQVETPSSHK